MTFDSLEAIKAMFASPEIKVISFDVFDTLLLRPVSSEEVKFGLLEKTFRRLTGANISFSRIRTMAEASLRRRILRGELEKEDVTLTEIYGQMVREFPVDDAAAETLKAEEEALEFRLAEPRKSGQDLYEEALRTGKRVIVITDMYLESGIIRRLLLENGYPEPERIFVSSDTGLRKSTGNLYGYVSEELGVQPGEIFHIGDSPEADVRKAEEKGLISAWLPRTMEAFERRGCSHQAEKMCRDLTDWEKALREPGMGIFRQMAANRYFDDPFQSFDPESDYNADPWFVGYAALGPEILALVRWLIENAKRDGVNRLLFLSRDGYLPMQAFRLLRETDASLPDCAYLYTSRIALLPAMIRKPADLYDLPVDITRHTVEKLCRTLSFCCDPERTEQKLRGLPDRPYRCGEPFTAEGFQAFIGDFIRYGYDAAKHQSGQERIRRYLLYNEKAPVTSGTAIFDMGYSGRIAQAILDAAGETIPVYFFHGDGSRQFLCEAEGDFRIRTFFDFNPYMESTLREYAYLENAPSCIGYDEALRPLFDCGPAAHYEESVLPMQRGALDMVRDYLRYFGEYERETAFRYHSAAIPFEAFLRHCSEADRAIYRRVEIDDELWGGRRDINLASLMEARLRKLPDYAKDEVN